MSFLGKIFFSFPRRLVWCMLVTETLVLWSRSFSSVRLLGRKTVFNGVLGRVRSYGFCGVSRIVNCLGAWKKICRMFGPSFVIMFLCGKFQRLFVTILSTLFCIVGVPSCKGCLLCMHKGLVPRYDGPFGVVKCVGPVAYRLKIKVPCEFLKVFYTSFTWWYEEIDQTSSRSDSEAAW